MVPRPRSVLPLMLVGLIAAPLLSSPDYAHGQADPSKQLTVSAGGAEPIDIIAERIEYLQISDTLDAEGAVVIVQGPLRLTADRVSVHLLTGLVVASGHAKLTDPTSAAWAERLEVNLNTDAGVLANGRLYTAQSNTYVNGRLLQRFSETHYRAKEGAFTNCDAQEGQVPAWRFKFNDADLNMGERLYLKGAWFCVNDVPVLPIPTFSYPIQTARESGALIPTVGYDNRFGFHYQQSFYYVINPSQDVMITPNYYSNRGYGSDLEYRYIINRQARGQWLGSILQDTVEDKLRGFLTGSHTQQVNPDLYFRARGNWVSDSTYLNQLSTSGTLRALPSQESDAFLNQRFRNGNLYFMGQYLQPLNAGGDDTFQRLPELGHRLVNFAPFDGPALIGMDTTALHWYRSEGFQFSRVDVVPGLETEPLTLGRIISLTPQAKFRETFYSRGATSNSSQNRIASWAGAEAASKLVRRFDFGSSGSLLHTLEPRVMYEYATSTSQSDIPAIDDVDRLPQKNLVTYSLRSQLLRRTGEGRSVNWLDLMIAQSYHLGSTPSSTVAFNQTPVVGTTTQPIIPATVPVATPKFSDVWIKAVIGDPPVGTQFDDHRVTLTVDTFVDPYRGALSQFNTDVRWQHRNEWYVEVGQRFTTEGNRPKRGDIWNPISFNEVFDPTSEIKFLTLAGAIRLPYGWTVGAKTYRDLITRQSSETDVVALYQNPCRCWSLGLYYIQFPDRAQYNFVLSLTGLGATEGLGTYVLRGILSPLLGEERGLPWPTRPVRRGDIMGLPPGSAQTSPSGAAQGAIPGQPPGSMVP